MILSIDEQYSPLFASRWWCYALKWDYTTKEHKQEILRRCNAIFGYMETDGDWWDEALTDVCIANSMGKELPLSISTKQQLLNIKLERALKHHFADFKYAKIVYSVDWRGDGVIPKIHIFMDNLAHKIKAAAEYHRNSDIEICISWLPSLKETIIPDAYFPDAINWTTTGLKYNFKIIKLQ